MPFATAQFLITYCRLPEAPSGPDPKGREGAGAEGGQLRYRPQSVEQLKRSSSPSRVIFDDGLGPEVCNIFRRQPMFLRALDDVL